MTTNKDSETWVNIGRIGRTYGVQGWLKIDSYTENFVDVLNYSPWYLTSSTISPQPNDSMQVVIEAGRAHGKGVVAKIPGYDSPEHARQLIGKLIYIKKTQLPPLSPNEYYWSDLIGLKVINKQGDLLGKVKYLIETGSNDVLVVQGDKEIAIPYLTGTVILAIDLDAQEMIVDWELL